MFEINLVPDVKNEMIKALKLRNWILFICIVVSGAAVAAVVILLGIKGGQDIVLTANDSKIEQMSSKMTDFNSLDEFLTIQDQLGNLSTISENQNSASRVFAILSAAKPQGSDTVTLSEMTLDLSESTLTLEGQANAGVEPLIDYRVLESYKKSLAMTTYDYGEYKDAKGNTIPAMCLTERDENGNSLVEDGSEYAIWHKDVKGCDPENPEEGAKNAADRDAEKDETVYRTPQFEEWKNKGFIELDGTISGVAHFESECITYTGTEVGKTIKWDQSENTCIVAPEGLNVVESSNGRNESEALVLRFTGDIAINPEVFSSRKNFMKIIGPMGKNVTDSYSQVENMFGSRAKDCAKDDTACQSTSSTGKGENK